MRKTNDPALNALDQIRLMTTRIELQLCEPSPDLEVIKQAARTIKVNVHSFTRFKG